MTGDVTRGPRFNRGRPRARPPSTRHVTSPSTWTCARPPPDPARTRFPDHVQQQTCVQHCPPARSPARDSHARAHGSARATLSARTADERPPRPSRHWPRTHAPTRCTHAAPLHTRARCPPRMHGPLRTHASEPPAGPRAQACTRPLTCTDSRTHGQASPCTAVAHAHTPRLKRPADSSTAARRCRARRRQRAHHANPAHTSACVRVLPIGAVCVHGHACRQQKGHAQTSAPVIINAACAATPGYRRGGVPPSAVRGRGFLLAARSFSSSSRTSARNSSG